MDGADKAVHGGGEGGGGGAAAATAADAYAALGATLHDLAAAPPGAPIDGGVGAGWTYGAAPFVLPPGLAVMLADVAGGSETPSMVRQVLAWRDAGGAGEGGADSAQAAAVAAASDEAQGAAMAAAYAAAVGPPLWRALAAANARVAVVVEQLRRLAAGSGGDSGGVDAGYAAALAAAALAPPAAWAALPPPAPSAAAPLSRLAQLAAAFAASRALIRAMGDAAGVPIEPAVQTALADATVALPGVLAAGVPGAGGYDALFAVVLEPEACGGGGEGGAGAGAVRAAVEACWLAWPGGGLTPLPLRDGPGRGEAGAGVLAARRAAP